MNAGRFGFGLIAACLLTTLSGHALPQTTASYPSKPIRLVVVYPAGGGADTVGRLVADRLSPRLGQPVIVENQSGAGGNVGTEHVARSAADGYTLLLTTNSHTINSFIYRNIKYDAKKDFTPIIQLTEAPSVLVATPSSPYRTLKDVVTAARSDPGRITYGSAGNGTPTHIAGELLKAAANIDLVHVPYRGGGPANVDVMGGQIPLAMSALPAALPLIQTGRLWPIAVTSAKRWAALPDVPTMAEAGFPSATHATWIGVFAPSGTPRPIFERLNKEMAAVLSNPEVRQRITTLGAEPVGGTAAHFSSMLALDYRATQAVVSRIGLKVD